MKIKVKKIIKINSSSSDGKCRTEIYLFIFIRSICCVLLMTYMRSQLERTMYGLCLQSGLPLASFKVPKALKKKKMKMMKTTTKEKMKK